MKKIELVKDVYFNEDNNWKAGTILSVPFDIGDLTYENILKAGDGKIVSEQIMIKESKKVKKVKDKKN
tara:strand:+ start:1139 stop:1342 length:204 start_codon:yes stop_codon:yes gene_type:complete